MTETDIKTTAEAETAPGQTTPVHGLHENSPDWFAQQAAKVFKFFAEDSKHKQQFEDWQDRREQEAHIAQAFNTLTDWVAAAKADLAAINGQVQISKNCDIAKSIFAFVKGNGPQSLQIVARDPFIASVAILAEHGEKVVQLAKADLAALEQKMDAFKAENKAVLKELGLI